MNKAELVNAMATETGLTKKNIKTVLNSFVNIVSDKLAKKEKVHLVRFGTFETRERSARICRNPQTGEEIKIEAATIPTFKSGKALKYKF